MIVAIHGMLGCGKTTLVENIERMYDRDDMTVLYEPVQDNPFLKDYYKNPTRYATMMQHYMIDTRLAQTAKAVKDNSDGLIISDVSVLGGFVYVNHMHDRGEICDINHQEFMKLENTIMRERKELLPDVIIYLTASKEAIHDRIFKRGRECEKSIDPKFVNSLIASNESYHSYLSYLGFEVIEIDTTNLQYDEVYDRAKEILDNLTI